VTTAEARELAASNPDSFVRVVRPEVDLDAAIDPHDPRVYERGAANLRRMIDSGRLVREPRPAFYVYRLTWQGRAQTGVVAACAVEDYLEGRIRRHEHTRPDKVEDRLRLNDAIAAHPGLVFLCYRPIQELNAVLDAVSGRAPASRFTAADGVEHALWPVTEPAERDRIGRLLGAVPVAYIADGHHRAAAAAAVAARRRERDPARRPAAHDFFMAGFFRTDELRILDYNRVVRDLGGLTPRRLVERVRDAGFEIVEDHPSGRPPRPRSFGMYLDHRWSLLVASPSIVPPDPVGGLDVSILTDRILGPVLGIVDLRTEPRVDFVGGSRGTNELERLVDEGAHAVAFALHPPSIDDVLRVADAGRVMPPKSTWFEPKLRSGLAVQLLDGEPL
jgi:uncharacterized protein (DUF1015 family)